MKNITILTVSLTALVSLSLVSCDFAGRKTGSQEGSTASTADGSASGGGVMRAETPEEIEHRELVEKLLQEWESPIRPGKKLAYGEEYVDEFEYVEYEEGGDYYYFTVRKPGSNEYIYITDGFDPEETVPRFNRGDMVRITWNVGLAWSFGDGETPYLTEWATKISRTEEGPVTQFRRKHPKHPRCINDYEREFFSDSYFVELVEYCLAISNSGMVHELINDPSSDICYVAQLDKENDEIFFGIRCGEYIDITAFYLNDPEYPRTIFERPDEYFFFELSTY
jgi:hypothetical protein